MSSSTAQRKLRVDEGFTPAEARRTADLATVGDMLFYHCGPGEAHNGSVVHPAVVTKVLSDIAVNLTIFKDGGGILSLRDVQKTSVVGNRGWSFLEDLA